MAKYYIRTKKNKYDIPVIIDVTSDEVFKNHTSSLPWEEVSLASPGPQKGHYWYDNKSIGLDSADYSEIQSIIEAVEAPILAQRIADDPGDAIRPEVEHVKPEEGVY